MTSDICKPSKRSSSTTADLRKSLKKLVAGSSNTKWEKLQETERKRRATCPVETNRRELLSDSVLVRRQLLENLGSQRSVVGDSRRLYLGPVWFPWRSLVPNTARNQPHGRSRWFHYFLVYFHIQYSNRFDRLY
jgi:hypothetical protein